MRATILCLLCLAWFPRVLLADGVFVWNKGVDLYEPSQKAVILHADGVEDLVLQGLETIGDPRAIPLAEEILDLCTKKDWSRDIEKSQKLLKQLRTVPEPAGPEPAETVRPEPVADQQPQGLPWGTPVDGLQARLAVPQTAVPLGSKVDFQLHLRFDPKDVDPKIALLNRGEPAWNAELVFRDTKGDKEFRRRPFDVGMPPIHGPEHIAALRRRSFSPERLKAHLLSDEGEQIPPSTYAVTVVYRNTAKPELEYWTDKDGLQRSRPHRGPQKFWKGTITTVPITLTVTPAEPEEVELKLNSALKIVRRKDGRRDTIGWTWAQEAPKTVTVKRRPGYVIGQRYMLHVFLDGEKFGEPRGPGMANHTWHDGGGMSFLTREIVERVLAGASLKLRADVEVFETSVPTRHMWSPEAGDFKTLWRGSVEGELKLPDVPAHLRHWPCRKLQTCLEV